MRDGTKGVVGVIRKKWQFIINAPFKLTNRCCDILKKDPVKLFEKQTGLRPIVGTMAVESNIRQMDYIKRGCIVWENGKEMCRPLSIFTEKDIEEIIKKYSIKICPIYFDQIIDGVLVTGERTTGCAWCGFGCHLEDPLNNRFHRLKMREPNRYKSMMEKMGYKEVLKFLNINIE